MSNIESEKVLERLLKKMIEEELKGWCLKLLSTHITGLPDRMCLIPHGRILFVELKTTKKKPTKRQLIVHRTLKNLGFRVEVIDTSLQIKNLVLEFLNSK